MSPQVRRRRTESCAECGLRGRVVERGFDAATVFRFRGRWLCGEHLLAAEPSDRSGLPGGTGLRAPGLVGAADPVDDARADRDRQLQDLVEADAVEVVEGEL